MRRGMKSISVRSIHCKGISPTERKRLNLVSDKFCSKHFGMISWVQAVSAEKSPMDRWELHKSWVEDIQNWPEIYGYGSAFRRRKFPKVLAWWKTDVAKKHGVRM